MPLYYVAVYFTTSFNLAIIGSFMSIVTLGEVMLYPFLLEAYNLNFTVIVESDCVYDSCATGSRVSYVYAVIGVNFLAVIFSLAMLIAAMYIYLYQRPIEEVQQSMHSNVYFHYVSPYQ